MISNNNLIKKYKGDLLAVENERVQIVDSLKNNLNRYFKGIGINAIISNFNNGDLRISVKKSNLKGFSLNNLFKSFNIKYSIAYESNTNLTYCIYVFN